VRWLIAVVMACACGRVGFEPIVDGNGGNGGGGGGDDASGTGTPSDGASPSDGTKPLDAAATECETALDVTVGTPLTTSTCVDGDHLKGCGPAGTQEVVFKFVAPATSGYNFAAYDHGTMNVSNSTAELDSTCTMAETCSGILGLSMNQNDVLYFIVEAASGGCATIDFTVTAS
jgi:hypothetical protein